MEEKLKRRKWAWIFWGMFLPIFFIPSLVQAKAATASLSDEELLETIQKKSFDYFVKERNPKTGLVRDRANNFQKGATNSDASIAVTGFALTGYAVGVERGWIDRPMAIEMTRRALQFFLDSADQDHGFFYHFLDMETGKRAKGSEVSPIDTALFLAGAIFSAEYYEDPRIRELAEKLYERVDWPWMLHGGDTLVLGWSPGQGFHKGNWDQYCESMIMYFLAIGSPSHPIPGESWQAVQKPVGSYQKYRLIQSAPLFTHQYSHIWIDFRDKNDGVADYFKNSVNATLANRAFCIDQASKFSSYGPNSWGLTASDGPFGYRACGAPPGWCVQDGTVAPTGCGGSIVFTPRESIACLRHFYEDLGDRLWGNYGFSDAFNLDKQWFSQNVIGIDQGTLLLMIENYRSGLVWKVMGKNTMLREGMKKAGFKPGTAELPWPDPPQYDAPYVSGGLEIDGYLKDWPNGEVVMLDKSLKESGRFKPEDDIHAKMRFAWDENALYFSADVSDRSVVARKSGKDIWQDDLVEIFINPDGKGLLWNDPKDFQIGFRPNPGDGSVEIWSWFQGDGAQPAPADVMARGFVHEKGFLIEGAIRWSYLGMSPAPGDVLRISPALHDIDQDRTVGKLQWFFRNEGEYQRFALGKILLKK